jgi:hypothetical protein
MMIDVNEQHLTNPTILHDLNEIRQGIADCLQGWKESEGVKINGDGSREHKHGLITTKQYNEFQSYQRQLRFINLEITKNEKINSVVDYEKECDSSIRHTEYNHESFGMVGISRVSSSGAHEFFGSSIRCNNWISLTIRRGIMGRDINHDWYHGKEELIEIALTPSQFAEMITGVNMGDGFPCTIKQIGGNQMDEPPVHCASELFDHEFKQHMEKIVKSIDFDIADDIERLKLKGAISKSERDAIAGRMSMLLQEIKSNLPYMAKCWTENLDKSTSEFKSMAESYLHNMIQRTGIEALQNGSDFPLIELSEKDSDNV